MRMLWQQRTLLTACLMLVLALFVQLNSVRANHEDDDAPKHDGNGFTSKIVAIKGSIVECENGFAADLSKAEITAMFHNRKIADLEVGLPIEVRGQLDTNLSNSTRTFFQAETVQSLGLRKEIMISAPLQNIDTERNIIQVLNKVIFLDNNSVVLRKQGSKLKKMKFANLTGGENVTIEADMTDGGLVARRVIRGQLDPFGNVSIRGFLTNVTDNTILEFVGGFKADVTQLLSNSQIQPKVDYMAGVTSNIRFATENPDLLFSFGYYHSEPLNLSDSLLDQALQAVNVQNRTITSFGRTYPLADDAWISTPGNINANLSEIQVGKRTGIGFKLTPQGLVVSDLTQF